MCLALMVASTAMAVPAKRGWQTMTQPDGTTIQVEQRGDEFYHYWVNESGQEMKRDANGYWQIVGSAPDGNQVAARMAAGRSARKGATIRKNYGDAQPTRLLVILVQFTDKSFNSKYNAAFYEKILNQTGGDGSHGCGSVKDYFNQSSDGNYIPTFDIFGPVTLSNNMAYYGANDSGGDDVRPREMALEACQKADAAGCNFANYDMNNDGKVDNVYIIYAGYGEAGGGPDNSIWPHSWEVSGTNKIDGKTIKHYACSPELSGGSGTNSDGIATFCHEFSHVIGMPDYYDTDYGTNDDNNATPGDWSLMDGGSYNGSGWYPPLYSIYDRYFMGWATPTILKDPENVTMPVGSQYARQLNSTDKLVACTNTSTVYYLENRQKTGFDSYNPGAGLVIWKVTYNATSWNNNVLNNTAGTLRYTVCRADGKTTNIGNTKDAMPTGGTSITPISGHAITNVALTSNVITFLYNGGQQQMTVTFDGNGHGTPASASLTEASTGSGVTLPSCSANTGYTFKGWATTSGAVTADAGTAGQKYYPTNNITLYAVYEHTGYANLEYSLEGVTKTSGPDAGEFLKSGGYSATFTAANGYDALTDDNCLYEVRVNNVDVTSTYASITSNTLTISIPSANITGGVSVTIIATKTKGSNTFEQVTSLSNLSAGDEVIFVNEGASVAAAGLQYGTTYLNGESQTINTSTTPHSLELPDETQVIIYTLGGSAGAWTFTMDGGNMLGTTGAKAVSLSSGGTTTWTLSFSGNNLVMTSTTSSYGSLQYNAGSPRFTTYTSSVGNLQIYKRAVAGDPVAPDFSFDQASVNMIAGETSTPQLPVTNSTGVITYTSSNPAVATVNASTGAVTAIKQGTAVITATVAATKRHLTANASYTVNVSRAAATITAVDNFTVKVGKTYSLDATTTSDAAISYAIADGSKLSREGKVFTGVAAGNTTVTLSTAQTDKYEAAQKVINVTVQAVVNRTVTWSADGSTTPVVYENGELLALPSTPANCSASRTFQGWTASSSYSADVPPTYITSVIGTAVTADVTYYAVYATSDAGAVTPTSVSKNSFTATSGDLDANISFAGAKGTAANDPYLTTDNYIRIYQNGGTFTVTANNSKKISAITLGSNQGTTIDVAVDGSSYATGVSLPTTTPYSTSGLNASTIVFTCKGTSKTTRLEVKQLSVTYLDAASSVKSDYSLTCSTAAKTDPTASFTESSKVMTVGDRQTQQVTTNSTGAVTYSSSAPAVASVNASTGEVTALTAGEATISVNIAATNKYNAKDNAASYTVTVNRATGTISASDITMTVGVDKSIGATTNTGATISYVSTNEAVATVTTEGSVHGVAVGSTTITMTTAQNDTHTAANKVINVTVNSGAVAPTISFPLGDATIAFGEPLTRTVSTNSDGAISYSSSNESVATVDNDGEITTVGVGTTTITGSVAASSSYTAHSATYTLTVTQATNTLTFAQASVSVQAAAFVTNVATAKFGTVVYESSNTDVATVDGAGKVKGVTPGTATITATVAATANYTAANANYEVTVTGAVGIDMQAHVASQEGRSAYSDYVAKQTAYYTGATAYATMMSQSGSELFGTLNTKMGDTKVSGGSYDDLRSNYVNVDRDLNAAGYIIGYYDGKSMNGTWDGGKTYNREHTWPQSKGASSSIPMGYDMQSVRPANASINSSRGNKAYGETTPTFYNTDAIAIDNINYKSSNRGSYHGDAARVILYDYIVYGEMGGHKNSYYNGQAQLLNKLGSEGVFESLAILLKWNMQDPPSLTEMVRNDGAQTYKGNRNPFVDYPELAILILKDQTGVTAYTVTNSTGGTLSPNYTYTTPGGFVTYVYNNDGTTHPSVVNVSGGTKESYDPATGRLVVSAASGNMVISSTLDPVVTYTITANSNDGAKGTVTGGGVYNENAIITLTATPTSGNEFVQWQDGSHVNPRSITVTGNATYTATFQATGSVTPEGDITVTWVTNNGSAPVVQKYFSGNALILPANPGQGGTAAHPKYFVGWSLVGDHYSAINKNPDDLFTTAGDKIVTKDVTYYAIFSSVKP